MNIAFRHDTRASFTPPVGPLARIAVFERLDEVAALWRRFEDDGAVLAPCQRYPWVDLWHRHVSPHQGVTPLVVVGFDANDNLLFLWPLARERCGPLTVGCFAGGKHATLNMPAWRPEFAVPLTPSELRSILDRVARLLPGVDLLVLRNQPAEWNGLRNPFCLLPHQRAVDDNYRLTLATGPDLAAANIGASARRRLRKKENQLARLPGYRYLRATAPDHVAHCLDRFFAQKAARLAALGVDNVFGKPGIETFVRAACLEGLAQDAPVIELHVLEGDGEQLALFGGIHDGRRFSLSFNSHTQGPHSRLSPGLVLLQHVIADCARRGFQSFDIGPGEARYKVYFCKEFEPLIDSILPLSPRGRVAALLLRGLLWGKAAIKHAPGLFGFLVALRRLLRGKSRVTDAANVDD